jgi:hypothetical protein
MAGVDIFFEDVEKLITIKEMAWGEAYPHENPTVPPLPREGEKVVIDDMPYIVIGLRHEWLWKKDGEFMGVVVHINVKGV